MRIIVIGKLTLIKDPVIMKWVIVSFTLAWVVLEDLSVAQMVKNLPAMLEIWDWSLGQEAPQRREWQSTLAWRISLTEEPGGLQSMGSQKVGHDWMTNTFISFSSNKTILVEETIGTKYSYQKMFSIPSIWNCFLTQSS